MHHGEKRVLVEGQVCPELVDGLTTAMAWIRHWSMPNNISVHLAAQDGFSKPISGRMERAASFLTGGIDSLATLRRNHLNFPQEHPGYIKDVLLVYGLEVDQMLIFREIVCSLSVIAEDAGVTLIPVYTNARYLDDDWHFWAHGWEGALLSAVAHTFSRRLTRVSIASSYDISNMCPHGSHPLLDPNYSSSDLRICHDGIILSRLAKTRLISEWPAAFQHMRVCNKIQQYRPVTFNCGKCEKCVRTMLTLVALGVLHKTNAFPANDVTKDLVMKHVHIDDVAFPFYGELILPLAQKGRQDLVQAINYKLFNYSHHKSKWEKGIKKWTKKVKRLDRGYLNSSVSKFKKILYG